MTNSTSPVARALIDSAPVAFGYIPLGAAFGVLFADLGYVWVLAPFAALIIFAGSAQFLAVGLLAAGAGYLEAFAATLVLNARHLFYGLSVLDRYPARGLARWYLMFGLTDETYSLVTTRPIPEPSDRVAYYVTLTAVNQSYWILGCTLGASLQSLFHFNSEGFEFALVALFVVLLLEQMKRLNARWPLLVALAASIGAYSLLQAQFLVLAIALCLAALSLWYVRTAHG